MSNRNPRTLPPGVHTSLPLGDDPVARVLNDAADLIERSGWCQGTPYRGDAFCAVAAIFISAGGRKGCNVLPSEFISAQQAMCIHVADLVPRWNDTPGRTKAEVVTALRSAASSRAAAMVEGVGR